MASGRSAFRLSKPLIGEDGKIYACSEKTLFAFESNGSVAWSLDLDFKCNIGMAPVHGGKGKIYLVAEDRVIKVNFMKMGNSESAPQVFFGGGPGEEVAGEISGLAVSTFGSTVFINVKNRGLYAFMTSGEVLWSAGPKQFQSDYHQGCRKSVADCYFSSHPVIDECEANISNTQGELYSISFRSPHYNWVQDFSSFGKMLTITSGNNGCLYVTIPVKALVFALDASSGNVLWQRSIGPISSAEYAPVVDSNVFNEHSELIHHQLDLKLIDVTGWISVGSLDGFLYSFSPTGSLHKFSKSDTMDSVIQVSPLLDCSGYAVYISQTKMSGKFIHTNGEYTYVSTMKPESVVFSLMAPATGSVYWSEIYPGEFSSLLSKSDLQRFDPDESLVLAFVTAASERQATHCNAERLVIIDVMTK
ncbi:protein GAMETE EXPRESSED 3-like [Mangifera indica]|uniref:protein GAMETE EXPRESSED 3-like n=1 Tax=Mangifera indica TaxID=29780 RepID=UPI001CFACEE7|nr:protein GAMETE EXPRESSED 3-like [Mangifera indica]